jgi:hypothetical protein
VILRASSRLQEVISSRPRLHKVIAEIGPGVTRGAQHLHAMGGQPLPWFLLLELLLDTLLADGRSRWRSRTTTGWRETSGLPSGRLAPSRWQGSTAWRWTGNPVAPRRRLAGHGQRGR